MAIIIDEKRCTQCQICVDICPEDVLAFDQGRVTARHPKECWYCGSCIYDCPHDAIDVKFDINLGIKAVVF